MIVTFEVKDTKTGDYADIETIARTEEWAKGLIYCDMEGFAITQDGHLILLDECGKWEYCPEDRFDVVDLRFVKCKISFDLKESE